MQVIIPLAGKGTRLRPHTHLVPKPLLKVAGKPVMDWVMERFEGLGVTELIFITGHLKEQVEKYARERYPIPSRFIEQKVQDGTAGAVNLARPYVKGPVIIVFVDTVFDADMSVIRNSPDDGIIWVKEVEDYQRFGVVVTDNSGHMTKIVEKPSTPVSKAANIGLYYIKDVDALWAGIDHVLHAPQNKGEWFLTDAFQHMIEHGRKIKVLEVEKWYDAGALGTTLETHVELLKKKAWDGGTGGPGDRARDVNIVQPCHIEEGVTIEQSTVGPHVSVEKGTVIRNSTITDSIIGARCKLDGVQLRDAMLGDDVVLEHFTGSGSIGSHTEVRGAKR